jgi:hypothetical protein
MARRQLILIAAGPTFSVSTLTPLFNLLAIGRLRRVLVTLSNPDAVNPVTLCVDPSSDGASWNTKRRWTDVADPLGQAHVGIDNPSQFLYLRGFAQTDSPFPTVANVTFEVRGEAETEGQYEWLIRNGLAMPG